ncbi:MAG: hypothetical protein LLG20_12905 [Acidobacteriales bacterium]|nr:hypothetical protein [Terriglobales bacterium]
MTEKLIHVPIEEARAAKWRRGREHYGPVFIGHPLEELDEELLDAMNNAGEAARQGFPKAGIAQGPSETLRTNTCDLRRGGGQTMTKRGRTHGFSHQYARVIESSHRRASSAQYTRV